MSLLVDYASSSEDEAAPSVSVTERARAPPPPPASSSQSLKTATDNASSKPKQKKKKKKKTTLYLPPEIQRLLETGNALSDDSDDDHELLAKHKRAKKAASKRPRPVTADKDSVLSFLPPPKHELPVAEEADAIDTELEEKQQQQEHEVATESQIGQQPVDSAAWQQFYHHQQYQASCTAASEGYYVAQGEDDVPGGSSKRRRTRERDIERALQQGHFETVAGQITEVQGPSSNAWQPPLDPLTRSSGSSDQEVKVKASFWNAQAGTKVSSTKPSRLQRQKHQLNQLAFDAKLRDFELLDKRSASLKTKRETYAKYGW
ncbi:uncharacterized protein KRP23_7228 [Phytophthora ramorum]|uniref:Uncharacterized protein n=1 Tax=Phytophthora ramorum TaxID=164328 RepID=H3GC75_PHYRM|nr:hypothetical protein KRP23_7228 [Phytophthora ramorum]